MITLQKSRAFAQTPASSIKGKKLEAGTVIKLTTVVNGTIQGTDTPNDLIFCETPTGMLKIPVREYMKFKFENSNAFSAENDSEEIVLNENFEVVSSEDREDRDGDLVYPSYAYKAFQEQVDTNSFDWNELKASGLKEDLEGKITPVQDYVMRAI
jgi:hypothetical protein